MNSTFSEDVMQQALSLIYLQSIEACLKTTISVYQYIKNNCEVIAPDKTYGVLFDEAFKLPVSHTTFTDRYSEICQVIQLYWPELLPKEEDRERKFKEYFKIIKGLFYETKTSSYSRIYCTFRFLISTILVCLMAEKGYFKPIPPQSYYHSGNNSKSMTLYHLLKTKHYSAFKISLISTLFEAVNKGLTSDFDEMLYELDCCQKIYSFVINDIIEPQKRNPKAGLVNLYNSSKEIFEIINYSGTNIKILNNIE